LTEQLPDYTGTDDRALGLGTPLRPEPLSCAHIAVTRVREMGLDRLVQVA